MEHQLDKAAGTAQHPGLVAQRRRAPHPSTMQMVIEALQAKDSNKGASVPAITRFILAKYPTVDPTRLKYWVKVTLSKGLSSGDLVRPRKSTATGAAGTFMLAPKMLKQKKLPGQADPDRGEPSKPAQPDQALMALGCPSPRRGSCLGSSSAHPAGAVEEKLTAAKQKSKTKATKNPPPAAAKSRSDGAKPPRAVGRPQGSGKGRSGPSTAPGAEEAGGDSGVSAAGAKAKRPRKTPVGKSKRKVPNGAQPRAPDGSQAGAPEGAQPEGTKVKGAEGKVRKPRVKTGAGQGQASLKKAVTLPEGKKAP
ncbi:histone H1.8 [Neopsephotus bourkii]|uniref:histone H1.8 n=1 Tax=Neopsephotus bourkii TaxID=309878 RepID=UPI002AA5D0E3|nr:histone H1.8 [Neopsephotus bourkii]